MVAIMAATAQAQAEATREAQQPASRMQRPMGAQRPTKVGSRATAASGTRARRRCWANPQAWVRSREVQGSRGRQSTASKMIRPALRPRSPFGARERSRSRWTGTARASQTTLEKTEARPGLHLDPIRRSTGPVHRRRSLLQSPQDAACRHAGRYPRRRPRCSR